MFENVFANSFLEPLDWIVIVVYLMITIGIGLLYTKRAGQNQEAFFVSGRLLPWYISGISIVATSFASDTPLWITNLVRIHGIHYLWQYWAPAIGFGLSVALFARLWRRLGLITDVEFAERRYSGNTAAVLRAWGGLVMALFFSPLIIGWVTKGMETIAVEAIGAAPEYRIWVTSAVVFIALISCAMSGLWGVVATSFMQFIVATVATILFAVFAVNQVGGLGIMVDKLKAMSDWNGNSLNFLPQIGSGVGQMPIWNVVGYFGLLWWSSSLVTTGFSGISAQRVLACKDSKHASFAVLFNQIVYHSIVCWPWIIVALCSLILIPDLGAGIANDAAYPRMIVKVMPVGFAGLLVVAMLAAFMSTMSTVFNLGSSYLVNDIYQRLLVRNASPKHYVNVGRVLTVLLAVIGGLISYHARDIQSLLQIMYMVVTGPLVIGVLRWFWWRITGPAEITVLVTTWLGTPIIIFGKILDKPMGWLFNLSPDTPFSTHLDVLGLRLIFMVVMCTVLGIVVSLLTKPTDDEKLREFILSAKPFKLLWKPIIKKLGLQYDPPETLGKTLITWIISVLCTYSLLIGIGKLLFGQVLFGLGLLVVFSLTLVWTVKRINRDFLME